MDNLTHSLVGALIGQAGLKKKTGLAMPALIIGANLPDVDAACFFWLEGVEHLGFRRGITHGPPALLLLPLILAGLLWSFDRWQEGRGKRPEGRLPVDFKWLYLLAFIGCLTHPALDWLNVYGIRLLEPFSSQWFYGDTLFIIDVWLWGVLIVATWLSLWREKQGGNWRRTAHVALGIAGVYILANGAFTGMVERGARGPLAWGEDELVIASPPPLEFWKREVIHRSPDGEWRTAMYTFASGVENDRPVAEHACSVPNMPQNSQTEAFLFWSRAPLTERAPDGAVLLGDARFYDPRARGRFTVVLPDVPCVEPSGE